ncbi:MAG: hypothetical protein QOH62_2553 [Solirubrobacteraceae bacterium]|jgi:hypothetical protein|nr:hypothetical protein [Solirubrobacteraceae bacterium]
MSQAEARAWWADVEHLREAAERRQASDDDMTSITPRRRFQREEPLTPQASMEARLERVHSPERRTVQITGRPVSALRLVEVERRRPARSPMERLGPRPDRIAMWAVLMGVFLCVVALSTAHP